MPVPGVNPVQHPGMRKGPAVAGRALGKQAPDIVKDQKRTRAPVMMASASWALMVLVLYS